MATNAEKQAKLDKWLEADRRVKEDAAAQLRASFAERQSMGRTLTTCSICGKPAMQAVCTRIDCK